MALAGEDNGDFVLGGWCWPQWASVLNQSVSRAEDIGAQAKLRVPNIYVGGVVHPECLICRGPGLNA